jgi:hypothetical protein
MTLADPKFISLTTIQFGKKIKDKKERFFLDPRWNTCTCCNWRQHLQRLSPHTYQPSVEKIAGIVRHH